MAPRLTTTSSSRPFSTALYFRSGARPSMRTTFFWIFLGDETVAWEAAVRFCAFREIVYIGCLPSAHFCSWSSPSGLLAATFRVSTPLQREPAWHRRARKARTRAQTTLRLYLSSGNIRASTTGVRAVRCLQGHHSRSDLPGTAIAKMQGQHSQQWWCYQCNQWGGAKAAFCHRCAAPQHTAAPRSTATTYTESWTVPWRASSASRSSWQRQQQGQQSPRNRRAKAKGADQGKANSHEKEH